MLVTKIGREAEYKQELIQALESHEVTANKSASIEQLERQLESKKRRSKGANRGT